MPFGCTHWARHVAWYPSAILMIVNTSWCGVPQPQEPDRKLAVICTYSWAKQGVGVSLGDQLQLLRAVCPNTIFQVCGGKDFRWLLAYHKLFSGVRYISPLSSCSLRSRLQAHHTWLPRHDTDGAQSHSQFHRHKCNVPGPSVCMLSFRKE